MSMNTTRGRGRRFKAEINVVPYIDVMLVLLVIFMVAAPLTNPSVINLPQASRSALPPTEYIQISLKPDAAATIGVNRGRGGTVETQAAKGRPDLLGKLEALHKANPEMPVMIAADKDIRYDEVIQTISEAKKIGIDRVGLATR
ncbi:ExbD/TolR family protein [Lacisediminimonas profundi]|uniref:ExbD/TolR family protein n=1 Tax=Lacisediminimonas profundi TaxID=2603856 RepID=UPI00124B7959|nr:ExbD/TolR family protein [Lacisediminimonas profundi]